MFRPGPASFPAVPETAAAPFVRARKESRWTAPSAIQQASPQSSVGLPPLPFPSTHNTRKTSRRFDGISRFADGIHKSQRIQVLWRGFVRQFFWNSKNYSHAKFFRIESSIGRVTCVESEWPVGDFLMQALARTCVEASAGHFFAPARKFTQHPCDFSRQSPHRPSCRSRAVPPVPVARARRERLLRSLRRRCRTR